MGIQSEHIQLISKHHVKSSLRNGGGLVFLALMLIAGLSVAMVVLDPVIAIQNKAAEMGRNVDFTSGEAAALSDQIKQMVGKYINWAVDGSPEMGRMLTVEKPVLISAILVVLVFMLPLITPLGASGQTAGDIGSRGLRFYVIRTERSNIFFGRFIGTYLFTLITLAILIGVILIYALIKVKIHGKSDMLLWSLGGYWRLALLALPIVALAAWLSAATDSTAVAMIFVYLLMAVLPLLVNIGSKFRSEVSYLNFISPLGYKWWLLEADTGKFIGAIAAMLAFTGLFLFLGARTLENRDV